MAIFHEVALIQKGMSVNTREQIKIIIHCNMKTSFLVKSSLVFMLTAIKT